MSQIAYKSHVIEADPYEQDDGTWQVNLYIFSGTGSNKRCMPYLLPVRCKTEKEAVQHCYQAACKIIDENSDS